MDRAWGVIASGERADWRIYNRPFLQEPPRPSVIGVGRREADFFPKLNETRTSTTSERGGQSHTPQLPNPI